MALLPLAVTDPVADAIFASYKEKYSIEPQRGYVGASSIGQPCTRALWYQFRWAKAPDFSGRLYRLFQSGHLQEPRVNADLRAIGMTVYDVNPATGKQWSFVERSSGGHFRGNCDGIVTGVPQAPVSPHILEVKTSSAKLFAVMQKEGVKKAKPTHYFQMQIYMHWSIDLFGKEGCHRALYITVNKDTDNIYSERIEYVEEEAQALIDKAMLIITSAEPPIGISTDPTYFECKFCDYHSICHGKEIPAPTCRTCAHVTPAMNGDGVWTCGFDEVGQLEDIQQRTGCEKHRYIPILLKAHGEPVDFTDGNVTYKAPDGKTFVNGDGENLSSVEIYMSEVMK
jgi:CRISPR/Cas system-associated exonuclease Cas4 (RecB family)